MSKKRVILLAALVIVIGLVTVCIFARSHSKSAKSPTKATDAIADFLGESVNMKEGTLYKSESVIKYVAPTDDEDNLYIRWTITEQVKPNFKILFLYENDSKVLMATDAERDFIDEETRLDLGYKDDKYHDGYNYDDGAFAWQYGGYAHCVLTVNQEHNCSSIWAYNEKTKSIFLVWYDNQASAWKDYSS